MRFRLIVVGALLAAGCVTENPLPNDTCRAGDYAGFVGAPLAASTFPAGVRVIGPDTVVTEDYVPTRLNVLVDGSGTITGFRCG